MTPRPALHAALAALVGAATLVVGASSVRAEDRTTPESPNFGRRSHLIVSVENILGGASESISTSQSTSGDENSLNSNGVFAGYTGPRVGVHAAFGPSITAGMGLGVWAVKDTTSKDSPQKTTIVRLAPRLGWVPALGPFLGLWLRAGPTIVVFDAPLTGKLTFVDLSFDALVAWTPFQHFGVIVGPQFDIAVSGKSQGSSDLRYQSTAFFAGLFVDL